MWHKWQEQWQWQQWQDQCAIILPSTSLRGQGWTRLHPCTPPNLWEANPLICATDLMPSTVCICIRPSSVLPIERSKSYGRVGPSPQIVLSQSHAFRSQNLPSLSFKYNIWSYVSSVKVCQTDARWGELGKVEINGRRVNPPPLNLDRGWEAKRLNSSSLSIISLPKCFPLNKPALKLFLKSDEIGGLCI